MGKATENNQVVYPNHQNSQQFSNHAQPAYNYPNNASSNAYLSHNTGTPLNQYPGYVEPQNSN